MMTATLQNGIRRLNARRHGPHLVALLLGIVATLVALGLNQYLPRNNDLSLVFIAAVVLAAINGGIWPALTCAGLGFLALNFFFTEPRGTFLMVRRDDVITVFWFLVVAVVVGRLAATLQEKLILLGGKEQFSRTELELMQQLALAIRDQDVIEALRHALARQTKMRCLTVSMQGGEVDWESAGDAVDARLRERVNSLLQVSSSPRSIPVIKQPPWIVLPLLAGGELAAFVLLECGDQQMPPAVFDQVEILVQQAGLALGRTRLSADLSRERFEKERELLRSSLLSSVSHDFRTPLTAMTGAASTLLEMGECLPESERRELLESIVNEARRLDEYTQNLLDMTRLGSGTLTLERNWISAGDLTDRVQARIQPHLRGHELQVESDDSLPLLHVHAALLEQAVFNVLHNAAKFSPPDSTLVLRTLREGRSLVIEVIDRGPGIPASEREAVFDMFHSTARGDRRAAGSGLGLAICKGMVGAHGGAVEVHDGPGGEGCMVRIVVPLGTDETRETGSGGRNGAHPGDR